MAAGRGSVLARIGCEPLPATQVLQGDRPSAPRPLERTCERRRRPRRDRRRRRDPAAPNPSRRALVAPGDAHGRLPRQHPHGAAAGAIPALPVRAPFGAVAGPGPLRLAHLGRDALARNRRSASASARGLSPWTVWPASGIAIHSPFGSVLARPAALSSVTTSLRSPRTTSVG